MWLVSIKRTKCSPGDELYAQKTAKEKEKKEQAVMKQNRATLRALNTRTKRRNKNAREDEDVLEVSIESSSDKSPGPNGNISDFCCACGKPWGNGYTDWIVCDVCDVFSICKACQQVPRLMKKMTKHEAECGKKNQKKKGR